jgi:predicted nucleotidyltransferase
MVSGWAARYPDVAMDDARAVQILREALPDVVAVYRFGSTLRGGERVDSDVDLAVLAASPLDPVRRFELQEELAIALRRDVDLVDLRRASTVMAMQVVSTGEPIGVLDPVEKERFEDYVFGAYARLNEERREILQQVLRDGTVHGR